LSQAMKAFLEPLTAIHDAAQLYGGFLGLAAPTDVQSSCEHPVVTRHPVTGRRILYVNEALTQRIVQLAPHESKALLAMLYRHCETMVELHCRVQWQPNTLTFWDNRSTQHHAVWDYFPNRRYGQRVSILGERPSRN
jgi:taurine dioxygenase